MQTTEIIEPVFFSIITPTHNPTHLMRAYDSLKEQTYKFFNWIVVPNNNADVSFLPKEDWIKIVPYTEDSKLIGTIKNFAFHQGTGDWLLELDHDDELLPTCLEKIAAAIGKNPNATFIYTDAIDLMPDFTTKLFTTNSGWEHYETEFKDRKLTVNKTFPPTPQAISRIWFAPNHARVWKANFYRGLGGHDITLKALDDQDLMCRTYIKGEMVHIPEALYVYYYHDNNSFSSQELNSWIQEYTLVLYEKYIYQMMERWADKNRLLKLDLCGGHNPPPGYVSIDMARSNIIHDLNTAPWPLGDNNVGVIRAHDALEHLKSPITTMKEIYRLLAPGGMLLSMTPSTDGRGAFQDPTHVSFWNSNSFWYYTRRETAAYINTPVRFQNTLIKNAFPTEWHKTHKIEYVYAHLTALKGGHENHYAPGVISI